MQKGRDARSAHDPKLALESFKAADEIMHVPTTGFEVARSQVDLGMLVEAHETLLAVIRIPPSPGEPQPFSDARGYARVLDDEVVKRIPQLRIKLQGVAADGALHGATIAVDGVALPEGALLVPYKVNPGHHVVTAKADAAEGRAETTVAERESKDVAVVLSASPHASGSPAATENPVGEPAVIPEEPPRQEGRDRGLGAVAWIGFGVGAAGLATGAVTGILTFSDKSSIASRCNGNRCPPSTYADLSSANTLATVSTVAFVVGAGGAVVGVLGWLLDRHESPAASVAHVTPLIGPGSVGLAGAF
jgi:hypothetical protein